MNASWLTNCDEKDGRIQFDGRKRLQNHQVEDRGEKAASHKSDWKVFEHEQPHVNADVNLEQYATAWASSWSHVSTIETCLPILNTWWSSPWELCTPLLARLDSIGQQLEHQQIIVTKTKFKQLGIIHRSFHTPPSLSHPEMHRVTSGYSVQCVIPCSHSVACSEWERAG